ncbi:MAG: hypothetical protein AAGG51_18395 [Cyanobacteria bacterium P01_G01_bin.54]
MRLFRVAILGLLAIFLLTNCAEPVDIPQSDVTPPKLSILISQAGGDSKIFNSNSPDQESSLELLARSFNFIVTLADPEGAESLEVRVASARSQGVKPEFEDIVLEPPQFENGEHLGDLDSYGSDNGFIAKLYRIEPDLPVDKIVMSGQVLFDESFLRDAPYATLRFGATGKNFIGEEPNDTLTEIIQVRMQREL